jgi:hypothetical protein
VWAVYSLDNYRRSLVREIMFKRYCKSIYILLAIFSRNITTSDHFIHFPQPLPHKTPPTRVPPNSVPWLTIVPHLPLCTIRTPPICTRLTPTIPSLSPIICRRPTRMSAPTFTLPIRIIQSVWTIRPTINSEVVPRFGDLLQIGGR